SSVENQPPATCEPVALKRIIRQRQALGALAGFPWDRATLSPVTCGTSCWRALYTNDLSFATILLPWANILQGCRALHKKNVEVLIHTRLQESVGKISLCTSPCSPCLRGASFLKQF